MSADKITLASTFSDSNNNTIIHAQRRQIGTRYSFDVAHWMELNIKQSVRIDTRNGYYNIIL